MLKILRKKGVAKKIFWFIAIIIIISFGFFGTTNYLRSNRAGITYAGKIFNRAVSFDDFERVHRMSEVQAMMRYGDNYIKAKPFLNLEAETWDRLILLHEANKKHINASDQDVVQAIQSYPFFQRDGQFDTLAYNDVLRYVFHIKARNFEEDVRDSLKIAKLYDQQTVSAQIFEEEIFSAYKTQNEKIQVSYVLISPNQFKNEVPFNEEQAQKYFEDNKLQFIIPPSINVEYLSLNFPENAKDADKESIRQKTASIFSDLQKNGNMPEVAQKNNLEAKTTGFFTVEEPILSLGWPFEALNNIFQLTVNQIAQPFETANGLSIVKVKEKKESYIPEYAEAKDKVKDVFLIQQAKAITREKADQYLKSIKEKFNDSHMEFPEIAKSLGLELAQTPLFNRSQYLPKIGISKEFQEAAFALSENNKISNAVEIPAGFCILHLDSYTPADKDQYVKEKDSLAQKILSERKAETFNTYLTRLRLAAKLVDNVTKLKEQGQ